MLLTKSVKNAAIHKKIFEFKPGRFTRVMTGVPPIGNVIRISLINRWGVIFCNQLK